MKTGCLIFILGVSGSGKNTILRMLSQRNPSLHEVISYKTRQLRPGEVDGVDYHFMSENDFIRAKNEGAFLESATIHNLFSYGTKKADIDVGLAEGKYLIKEIDIQGLEYIVTHYPSMIPHMLTIFLDVPDDLMTKRITMRAPISQEELSQRHMSAMREREKARRLCSIIIDSSGTPEEVYATVQEHVDSFIQKHAAT